LRKLAILILAGVIIGTGYTYVKAEGYQVINKQEQKQLQEEVRADELSKLHNPQYIEGQIHKVGKLVTLEGTYKYQDTITEKGLWDYVTLRQMTLDLEYKYGIGIDLQYIKVSQVIDKTVVIQIPKNRINLMYLQLNQEQSKVTDGKKMILVDQFKPSEVETIVEQSQNNVANQIGNNKKYYSMAMDNLKVQLEGFVKKLDYEKVIFEEV
jgi:hypothetical protein